LADLGIAFAYEFPPRTGAVGFFSELPDEIRQSLRYVQLEGIMHYHRGDLAAAEDRFAKARELSPDKIRPILMQAQTLLRQKREAELPDLITDIDLGALQGTPEDRANFAQVLAKGGRVDDALALGFDTLEANRNDPKV